MPRIHYFHPQCVLSECGKKITKRMTMCARIEGITCKSCLKALRGRIQNEIYISQSRIERIRLQEQKLRG